MHLISSLERRGPWAMLAGVVVGTFCVVALAQAATTISTSISTDGALSVGTLSTLTGGFVSQASSSVSSTLDVSGAVTLRSGLTVTGSQTISSNLTTSGTASSTNLVVGSGPANSIAGLAFGYCTVTAAINVAATSTNYAD